MLRMLGRMMWVAVGALGVKAWQAAEEDQRKASSGNGSASVSNGTTKRARSRKRTASSS